MYYETLYGPTTKVLVKIRVRVRVGTYAPLFKNALNCIVSPQAN